MHRERKLWTALTLALAVAATGLAQEQEPAATGETEAAGPGAEEGAFFESVDVNIVNVQVFVTDKKGNPITGLGIDDFDLFEDKRPVKISNFFAVEGRQPVAESAATTLAVEQPLAEQLELLPE